MGNATKIMETQAMVTGTGRIGSYQEEPFEPFTSILFVEVSRLNHISIGDEVHYAITAYDETNAPIVVDTIEVGKVASLERVGEKKYTITVRKNHVSPPVIIPAVGEEVTIMSRVLIL